MKTVALVALGGAMGSVARYLMVLGVGRWLGTSFPWGTLSVNLLGCFLMGLLTALFTGPLPVSSDTRIFFTTGLLGGFTTFSAFGLDASGLIDRGDSGAALMYLAGSVALGYAGVRAGAAVIRLWTL
jgi:CrcB protein